MKTHINTFGIILATIGAILVWRYLNDLPFIDSKAFMQGKSIATIPPSTPETRKKLGKQRCFSLIGIWLISLGALIQVISNYLPDC